MASRLDAAVLMALLWLVLIVTFAVSELVRAPPLELWVPCCLPEWMEVIPAWCWPSRRMKAGKLRLAISVSRSKPRELLAGGHDCSQHHLDSAVLRWGRGWDGATPRAGLLSSLEL